MVTFDALMRADAERIAPLLGLDLDEARLEVQRLLGFICNVSRASLLAHCNETVPDGMYQNYQAALERRMRGEPLAYIRGYQPFFGHDFAVDPAVLIPRPDTELLVETALDRIAEDQAANVLDLGTGSGIVALCIAHHRPVANVWATDVSAEALRVARQNAQALSVPNVRFLAGHWFNPVTNDTFDVIVSNPPYVCDNDPHLAHLNYEPKEALCAGVDGLDALRVIIQEAPQFLSAGGLLAVEHGFDQSEACRALFASAGFEDIRTARDLGGNERVTCGAKPSR